MAMIRRSAGRRKFYIAYGSNLDKARMAQRCPQAVPYASGWLDGWELIYRGSKTGNYATIRPAKKEFVPVGIWQITDTRGIRPSTTRRPSRHALIPVSSSKASSTS